MSLAHRRRLPLLVLAAVAAAACTKDSPTAPPPPAQLILSLTAPSFVAQVTLTIKGPGIQDSVVHDLLLGSDSVALDTLQVSAGSGRIIRALAFDSSGVNTHRADTTLTLSSGVNQTLRLVLIPLTGTLPIQVSFGTTERIVFFSSRSGRMAVWMVNPDGSGLRKVTADTVTADELIPEPSPDGRTIAFIRSNAGLWRMDLFGGRRFRIAANGGGSSGIGWSPDGSEILYQNVATCAEDLYEVRPDGTGQRLFVDGGVDIPTQTARNPSWSVAGKIAFDSRPCGRNTGTMWLVSPDRTGFTLSIDSVEAPRWSPDGTRIIAYRFNGTHWHIWTMNGDGSGLTQLTSGNEDFTAPAWSPDGTKIVFSRGPAIWIMNADGSSLRQLTTGPDQRPVWFRVQ